MYRRYLFTTNSQVSENSIAGLVVGVLSIPPCVCLLFSRKHFELLYIRHVFCFELFDNVFKGNKIQMVLSTHTAVISNSKTLTLVRDRALAGLSI